MLWLEMQRGHKTVLPMCCEFAHAVVDLGREFMKHIYRTALAFLITVGMAQADPLFGIWQSTADDNGNFGHIEMQDCDGKIFIFLYKMLQLNLHAVVFRQIVPA